MRGCCVIHASIVAHDSTVHTSSHMLEKPRRRLRMRLEIHPISGPADETLLVKVIDGPPESEVTITVAVKDAKDHRWESRNVFRTDASGTVDISREAPVSGSYTSTDPAGPLWSMRFASE